MNKIYNKIKKLQNNSIIYIDNIEYKICKDIKGLIALFTNFNGKNYHSTFWYSEYLYFTVLTPTASLQGNLKFN